MAPTLRGQNDELVCSSICFARSARNPHNVPKTSNLVLNLGLNPEPPSYSAISYRGLCNPSRNRLEGLLNERSKVLDQLNDTTWRGHGHCVLSQTHLTGATRIPQFGLGVPLPYCNGMVLLQSAERNGLPTENTPPWRAHRLSFN
jgi:hypothetical protein